MRSTYDRRGGNEAADASHFLYQLADDNNVTLDVEGPGVFYFARYNHWHGSPWRYVVDGREQIVRETSTADPSKPVPQSIFEPKELFPPGLTWTWSTTKGADLSWVPIGFERSFRMGYSRTCYGTGYYIYHQYVRGAKLSRPIVGWDAKTPPEEVLRVLDGFLDRTSRRAVIENSIVYRVRIAEKPKPLVVRNQLDRLLEKIPLVVPFVAGEFSSQHTSQTFIDMVVQVSFGRR